MVLPFPGMHNHVHLKPENNTVRVSDIIMKLSNLFDTLVVECIFFFWFISFLAFILV